MKESIEQQLFFMRWAIQLGEKGRCSAPPNPWVGCVIVKEGEILGSGFHEVAGKKHAEVIALEQAGILAKGATVYVSLEPCSHQGRTSPCVDALISYGVSRVIIPFLDPDPRVSGRGVEKLRSAGIEVIVGIGSEEAKKSLAPYLFQRTYKRPFCVLKSALSLDGKIAAVDGSSQWISGEKARADVHALRAESQAIMIGSGTALKDMPSLTVRTFNVIKQPLRVLLDARGRVPAIGALADCTVAPTLVFISSADHAEKWKKCGAEVIYKEKFTLQDVLQELGKKEIIQVFVEGGSQLHASFIKENLANRLILYYGNCLLGGEGYSFLEAIKISNIKKAPRLVLESVQRLDNDVRLDFLMGD